MREFSCTPVENEENVQLETNLQDQFNYCSHLTDGDDQMVIM